jgi:hypothetical protein
LIRTGADQPLVEAAKNSANVERKIWQLVEGIVSNLSRGKGTQTSTQDAYTVYFYLKILYKSGKLDMTSERARRMCLKIAKELNGHEELRQMGHDLDESSQQIAVNVPMRDIFRWVVGSDPMSLRGFKSTSTPPHAAAAEFYVAAAEFCSLEDDFDVCILAPFQLESPGRVSEKFLLTLQNYLGLHVVSIDGKNSDLFGQEMDQISQEDYLWQIEDFVRLSRSIFQHLYFNSLGEPTVLQARVPESK